MSDTGGASSTGTIPATSTASSAGSTHNYGQALTLVGGLDKAYTQYATGQENQKVARFNAERARIQAAESLQAGEATKAQREAEERLTEGGTRSSYAAQGVVVGAGTSRAVLASEANAAAMDKMMLGLNARRQAYGHELIAMDQVRRGRADAIAGETEAVSTLVGTEARYRAEEDPSYHGTRFSK